MEICCLIQAAPHIWKGLFHKKSYNKICTFRAYIKHVELQITNFRNCIKRVSIKKNSFVYTFAMFIGFALCVSLTF